MVDVIEYSTFIKEGWDAIKGITKNHANLKWEDFVKFLFHVASLPDGEGVIALGVSKNDKPLWYVVVVNGTEYFGDKTSLVYASYSTGLDRDTAKDAMSFVERWSRQHDYVAVKAYSSRINGAAMRLFKRKLGFKPVSLVFKKDL